MINRIFCYEQQKEFKKAAYFKNDENNLVLSIDEASRRAYRDLCRTLKGVGKCKGSPRDDVDKLIEEYIEKLSQYSDYDVWHCDLCNRIIKIYDNTGYKTFTYGHAQKWVNMVMKYLIIYADDEVYSKISPYAEALHVPIDSYIFGAAKEDLVYPYKTGERGQGQIFKGREKWKVVSDYRSSPLYIDEYKMYQNNLKKCIAKKYSGKYPICWEFEEWQKENKKRNKR